MKSLFSMTCSTLPRLLSLKCCVVKCFFASCKKSHVYSMTHYTGSMAIHSRFHNSTNLRLCLFEHQARLPNPTTCTCHCFALQIGIFWSNLSECVLYFPCYLEQKLVANVVRSRIRTIYARLFP